MNKELIVIIFFCTLCVHHLIRGFMQLHQEGVNKTIGTVTLFVVGGCLWVGLQKPSVYILAAGALSNLVIPWVVRRLSSEK